MCGAAGDASGAAQREEEEEETHARVRWRRVSFFIFSVSRKLPGNRMTWCNYLLSRALVVLLLERSFVMGGQKPSNIEARPGHTSDL